MNLTSTLPLLLAAALLGPAGSGHAQDPAPDAAPAVEAPPRSARMRFESGMSDKEALALAVREERTHRERSARIRRLHQLAVELGDDESRAKIEQIRSREVQRHAARLRQAEQVLAPKTYEFVAKFIAAGSQRTPATAPKEGQDG